MTRLPILAVLVAAGCGGGQPRPVLHDVVGRVEVYDRPAGGARVAFHPVDRNRTERPVAISRADGSFALTTYTVGDGAPAGEYVVTVLWPNDAFPMDECDCPDPARHDRLFGLHSDAATSELRATVVPGSNVVVVRPAVGGRGWSLPPLAADRRARHERVDADARAERERNGR
ncbi:MAG: hypothetical protein U0804_17740 [Gemmataceae bacterium]